MFSVKRVFEQEYCGRSV